MGANVFANGREISAKKSDNQSIAAMPDVCLSPPSPPAGPIPIPYPNFSNAHDTTNGTKTVKIGGDEVGMKNQSNYKTSKGDEAATRTLGMGVVTHTIQGTTYFAAWSSDVMVEGANVTRFMDMTTHNHANPANSQATQISVAAAAMGPPPNTECSELKTENQDARSELGNATADKSLVGPGGNGKGTTVSSGRFSPLAGGAGKTWSAHNNQKAHQFCKRRFAYGGKSKNRAKGKSNLCSQAGHSYPAPTAQKSGHAEARILDEMFKKGNPRPGRVTFNIDWRPKKGAPSKMPCESCHEMMCAAAACGVQIYLCAKDGSPKNVGPHCPATSDSYVALKDAMGEL